jgi:hypothetical protein
MQLSLKLAAFVAVVLAQAAEAPFAPTDADDSITPSHFQESSFSPIENSHNEVHPLDFGCEVNDPAFFTLDGPYTRYSLSDLPDETLFDARRATWKPDVRRNSPAVRLNGGEDICWIGGHILAHGTRQNAESSKTSNNVGIVIKTGRSSTSVAVNGLKIERTVNGMNIKGRVDRILLRELETFGLDGTCMNFELFRVAAVYDSLFDGCGRLFHLAQQSENIGNELLLEDNVIRINVSGSVTDGSEGYNPLFNLVQSERGSFSVRMNDNVILFEGNHEFIAEYISNRLFDGVVECANNIFVLPGGVRYQLGNSDCGFITDDTKVWEEARKAWINRHLGDASSSNLDSVSTDGTQDPSIADVRADALDYVRSRVGEGVDGTRADRSFHVLDANGAPDVVAESRRSTEQAIARAEEAATAMASFLGRWADGTFWHDGTGWLE